MMIINWMQISHKPANFLAPHLFLYKLIPQNLHSWGECLNLINKYKKAHKIHFGSVIKVAKAAFLFLLLLPDQSYFYFIFQSIDWPLLGSDATSLTFWISVAQRSCSNYSWVELYQKRNVYSRKKKLFRKFSGDATHITAILYLRSLSSLKSIKKIKNERGKVGSFLTWKERKRKKQMLKHTRRQKSFSSV